MEGAKPLFKSVNTLNPELQLLKGRAAGDIVNQNETVRV